jgi:hypothetical protein
MAPVLIELVPSLENSRANRYSRLFEAFDLLPLASFVGAPYSLDETGVVKCVVKAACAIRACIHIADKMRVDLSHVDRAHEPAGDRGLVGRREWDVRRELEIPSLGAVGVITVQAEPSPRTPGFETEVSVLRRYATADVSCEYRTRTRLPEDVDVIGGFTHTLLASVRQLDSGPENLGSGIDFDDFSKDRFHQIERVPRTMVSRLAPEVVLLK